MNGITQDLKEWYALSCPVNGVRFDKAFLDLLDADKDGVIRTDDVQRAIASFDTDGEKSPYAACIQEFVDNFVTMKALYTAEDQAMFQLGVLRIDSREMHLCFEVADEEKHSQLTGYSNCHVIYLELSRPGSEDKRHICAVVTAGTVSRLYVGRNGVFYDRNGELWNGTITRIVENQVSLVEAFWAPWKKLGEAVAGLVKKFIGDKHAATMTKAGEAAKTPEAGGAAMASSVAAIGIGLGMMGAAMASLMAVIAKMQWYQILIAIGAAVLIVSLPSVILTYFKLRKRDLGAVLNASGWAINRPMRFSMRRARAFTRKARMKLFK